ncbi:MAG: RNA methyltransferase [ANME-2 cluster archaeon]|nr:RNA methyltransferase [ANME-2 cluster archaeon]
MDDNGLKIRVVLVEPLYEGNVGSTARAMKNFGFHDLVLVNPCDLGGQARAFAMHARDILENASVHSSIQEAFGDSNLIIAATGNPGMRVEEHIRTPAYTPAEIKAMLEGKNGTISILFGREDKGLNNDELKLCDIIMSIPTSFDYPSMNLSHSVAVVLYELCDIKAGNINLAQHFDLGLMYGHIREMLDDIDYPAHKKDKTMLMLQRILGRTRLTSREVQTIRGLLRRIQYRLCHSIDT